MSRALAEDEAKALRATAAAMRLGAKRSDGKLLREPFRAWSAETHAALRHRFHELSEKFERRYSRADGRSASAQFALPALQEAAPPASEAQQPENAAEAENLQPTLDGVAERFKSETPRQMSQTRI